MNQIIFIIIFTASGLLKAKTEQYGCDFETSCDVINFDSFWGLAAADIPFRPNAPDHDHTYYNSSGHYMFFDLNSGPEYTNPTISFIKLYNNTLNKTTDTQKCLQFYYVINSRDNRNLTVKFILGDGNDVVQTWLIVNTIVNKTADWNLAETKLPNDAFWIQMQIELTSLPPPSANFLLTIDDIFITDDCMIETIQYENNDNQVLFWCDLEKDNCSFENTMKLEWKRVAAGSNVGNGPPVDHTFNSVKGNYLTSVPLSYLYGGIIERVVSMKVTIPADNSAYCLSFYYYMSSYPPFLNVFAIPLNGTSENITYQLNSLIWPPPLNRPLYNYILDKWSWGVTRLAPGTFKIAFLVSDGKTFDMKMAIDDIKVYSCPAVNDITKSYLPEFSYYFEINCDFESDRCGFSDTFNDFTNILPSNWSRINGHQVQYPNLGPVKDHTTDTIDGHFLNANFTVPTKGGFHAATRSALIFAHREMCVEFYYYANTEIFSATSKSSFQVSIGGCYATYMYGNAPYKNSSTEQKWNRVLFQLIGYSCREFLDFSFFGGDYLKMTFAIDDFRINRCDILNNTINSHSLAN